MSVTALAGGTFSEPTVGDGDIVQVDRGITSIFVSRPSGEGGDVAGPASGIYPVTPGQDESFDWSIPMNSIGPEVTYEINIRQFS